MKVPRIIYKRAYVYASIRYRIDVTFNAFSCLMFWESPITFSYTIFVSHATLSIEYNSDMYTTID